jgi:hypothetical protein
MVLAPFAVKPRQFSALSGPYDGGAVKTPKILFTLSGRLVILMVLGH